MSGDRPGAEKREVAQPVCAWCSERVGESRLELRENSPAGHEAHNYCSNECLKRWLNAD